MKSGTIITLSIALLAVGGGITYYQDPTLFGLLESKDKLAKENKTQVATPAPRVIPGTYNGTFIKSDDWVDIPALKISLEAEIRKNLKGTDEGSIKAFIAEPANRLLLAQWHIAARESESANACAEQLKRCKSEVDKQRKAILDLENQLSRSEGKIKENIEARIKNAKRALEQKQAELDSPRTIKDALGMHKGSDKFIAQVTNNLDMAEQLAYSGECVQPGRFLGIMAAIAKREKDLLHKPMERDIAAATALEWAKSGWAFDKALARAKFYIENWQNDRFHTGFDSLPFWQRRIICGSKGNNGYGEAESLQWSLDNVHLPAERYSGSCWQCAYRLHNLFGDSIHGSHYYAPYAHYDANQALRTKEVGGVCGSLSHFGAFAAIANGVPALTAGEPQHCAYIVNVNGRWVPSYSLSWKRGLHWQVWRGVHKYSSLHMATDLYSAEEAENTRLSFAALTLAEMYVAGKEQNKAQECYLIAEKAQPLNYQAWRSHADFLIKDRATDKPYWNRLHDDLCLNLTPRYPEIAAELLSHKVYPTLVKAEKNKNVLFAGFSVFWKALKTMGPDRWDVEAFCNAQLDAFCDYKKEKDPKRALKLYTTLFEICAGNAKYAPVILAWGNGIAAKMTPEVQKQFLLATITGLGNSVNVNDKERDKMLGQALQGAARMRDLNTYRAIAKFLSDTYRKPKGELPAWEPFPGELVSRGGLIYTSSSSHDDPAAHWGVLEPVGGRFHTANEVNPWVVVQMPKTVYVTGVVAISNSGQNVRRLHDMKVEYSESGRDDDWHDAGAMPAPSTKVINRLDLKDSKPRARFIRITRGGGKDFFHLNAIFVYGEQAS